MTSLTVTPPARGPLLGHLSLHAVATRDVLAVLGLVSTALAVWLATRGWTVDQRLVLIALATATVAWVGTRIDDTVVALGAVIGLALTGALPSNVLFGALGNPTIWLLVGSCMLAVGLTASGLTHRVAHALVGRAGSVRGLWHRTALALFVTTFAIPATSGRAAVAMPIFRTLAAALPRPHQVALSLLFPAVILLSAFASILGAGAHLVAANLIETATGTHVSFTWWLLLGLPVALVSTVATTEIILTVHLRRAHRRVPVEQVAAAMRATRPADNQRLSRHEGRALAALALVISLWLSESLHGLDPALVAMLGGLLAVLPGLGTTTPEAAFAGVPWSLLVFVAATLALGTALVESGAAGRLAAGSLVALDGAPPVVVLVVIVVVSAAAHLAVQSRTARSSVLLPIVLVVAAASGLNPVAAALASTAAAGFCLTLTSSAKPVAVFAAVDDVAAFDRRRLLGLAAITGPLLVVVVLLAAVVLWPALGVPLTTP